MKLKEIILEIVCTLYNYGKPGVKPAFYYLFTIFKFLCWSPKKTFNLEESPPSVRPSSQALVHFILGVRNMGVVNITAQ